MLRATWKGAVIMTDKLDSKEADLDIENGMIANNSFAEGKAVNN